MDRDRCVEVLEELKDYVNENWDEEYRKSIDEVNEAILLAIKLIRENKACGTMQLNGETYLISK